MGLVRSAGPYSHPNDAIHWKVLMAYFVRRRREGGREAKWETVWESVRERGSGAGLSWMLQMPSFQTSPLVPRLLAPSFAEVVGGSSVQHTSHPMTSLSFEATWQQFSVIVNSSRAAVLVFFWKYVHDIPRGEGCVRMAHRDYGTNWLTWFCSFWFGEIVLFDCVLGSGQTRVSAIMWSSD